MPLLMVQLTQGLYGIEGRGEGQRPEEEGGGGEVGRGEVSKSADEALAHKRGFSSRLAPSFPARGERTKRKRKKKKHSGDHPRMC